MTYYNEELYHYGVQGMKWGVRRYQNEDGSLTDAGRSRQARKYSRELNKMDKSTIRVKRTVKEAESTAAGFEQRAKRSRNAAKKMEFEARAKNTRNSVNEERKLIENNQKKIDDLVKQIQKEGYTVNSRDVRRFSNRGSDYAKMALIDAMAVSFATLGGIPYTPILIPGHTVEGKKYKVKNPKG